MNTVYMFYISEDGYEQLSDMWSPDIISPNPTLRHPYELYAVTTSKKYAKIFKTTRNPNYFKERQIFLTDKELKEFQMKYYDYTLGKKSIRYGVSGEHTSGTIVVVLPEFEYRHLRDDILFLLGELISDDDFRSCPEIFDTIIDSGFSVMDPFIKFALDTIYYTDILYTCDAPIEDELDETSCLNELYAYQKMYGVTYRRKGIWKLCESGNII